MRLTSTNPGFIWRTSGRNPIFRASSPFASGKNERTNDTQNVRVGVYIEKLVAGLRFPLCDLIVGILNHYEVGLGQLAPNAIHNILGFHCLCRHLNMLTTIELFRRFFSFRVNCQEPSWFCIAKELQPRPLSQTLGHPSMGGSTISFVDAKSLSTKSIWHESAALGDSKPKSKFSVDDEKERNWCGLVVDMGSDLTEEELKWAEL